MNVHQLKSDAVKYPAGLIPVTFYVVNVDPSLPKFGLCGLLSRASGCPVWQRLIPCTNEIND